MPPGGAWLPGVESACPARVSTPAQPSSSSLWTIGSLATQCIRLPVHIMVQTSSLDVLTEIAWHFPEKDCAGQGPTE